MFTILFINLPRPGNSFVFLCLTEGSRSLLLTWLNENVTEQLLIDWRMFERSYPHGFLKSWLLMNLKERLTIYVPSREKKCDLCLSHQPSVNMLPGSHLGLVHRLKDPVKSCLLRMDSGSSDVDNGFPCLLNMALHVHLRQKAQKGRRCT